MAIKTFNISFVISRDNTIDHEYGDSCDEEYIANEIKSWLEDIDYGVTNIQVNDTKHYFI